MLILKIPTDSSPEWAADQAGALRTFLSSAHGQAALQQLYLQRPSLSFPSVSEPFDEGRRRAGAEFIAGFESCIQTLLFLTVSPTNNG